ncbi:type II and III secretion system protein family protein [Pelagibacterium montanilacus]|uniref:type II and III secretion system protein family protein n=1 Tax=Pelagibacterium montanilacus TaxID=2185280 RepID=UPI0013DFA54B|nr:type II and III secretion system protein family protein [Pelagibacterium montanilacus]
MTSSSTIASIGAPARLLSAALLGLTLVLGLTVPGPALANSPHLRIAHSEVGRTQHVEVGVNKSLIIDLPVEAGEVIVSQPNVANAIMRTRSRAVIQGVSSGETNIFFLDPNGGGIAVVEISVVQDSSGLAATINRLVPGSRIQVQSFSDAVVLSGQVASADDLERALGIAGQYVGDPARVTSVIDVAGGQQVALKVVVAEVKRDTAHELGIDLSGQLSVGAVNLGVNNIPNAGATTNGYSADFSGSNLAINASLRALESRQAVRLLAEPVLTAMSGHAASFHVGGELPIRVSNDDDEESFEFKPYGIQLDFTPTVRSNGIIALEIDTEVSEPQLNNTLNTRRASTSVELGAYQTLAIAGLFEERSRRQVSELPGLGNIPILGALFRSHEYITEQTELVILVTPMIAHAQDTRPVLPTEKTYPTGNAEATFLGRMEHLYGVGHGSGGGQFRGSVGFVID